MRCVLRTILVLLAATSFVVAADPPRARDLGIPFDGTPGPWTKTLLAAYRARVREMTEG